MMIRRLIIQGIREVFPAGRHPIFPRSGMDMEVNRLHSSLPQFYCLAVAVPHIFR